MIRKFKIGEEELEFKMTNKTVIDIDEIYNNYGTVINGILFGENIYNNAFKLVSASCISRKLTFEELVENLTPDQISEKIVNFAFDLYADWRGIKEASTDEEDKENNDKKKA
ncbi:RNA polymerase subunit sigma [Clostridium perfringens]|nr:RNA polymerase subunit sigma [Clostridium perfringens]MDM0964536.1 RNA polymerase subunit sigma [Clostridium perfringens]